MSEYKLPPTFILDHVSRDLLPENRIVKQTKSTVTVQLSDDEVAELRSDAEHYVHVDGPNIPGLKKAALAVLARLDA